MEEKDQHSSKKELSWNTNTTWIQGLLQSFINQDSADIDNGLDK